jgi:hypothetical protein
MQPQVIYHWDFEFQGRFEVDVPQDQRPYLALAGGLLHGDMYGALSSLFLREGAVELVHKRDFERRDKGFSRNRAIRGADLKVLRVIDEKCGKSMLARPDVVDYRNDRIIDLKTHYIRKPPDDGGILITSEDVTKAAPSGNTSPIEVGIPDGYEDAWGNLKAMIQADLDRKYGSQFQRYHRAYLSAIGRVPEIHIYVVLYTVTRTYKHGRGFRGMRRLSSRGFQGSGRQG